MLVGVGTDVGVDAAELTGRLVEVCSGCVAGVVELSEVSDEALAEELLAGFAVVPADSESPEHATVSTVKAIRSARRGLGVCTPDGDDLNGAMPQRYPTLILANWRERHAE
jgi:phosphotransferase system IIA component